MATKIHGTAGADTLTGDSVDGNDFRLDDGGNDTATGLEGNDFFHLLGTLTGADRLTGGLGIDTVYLKGDYSAGVTLEAATLVGIEKVSMKGDFNFNVTTNDGNVAAGETMTIAGGRADAAHSVTFNGSAELDGTFRMRGGAGNDSFTGGANGDSFYLGKGGADTAHGGDGDDSFHIGGAFTAADTLDGGAGTDSVHLGGDYLAPFVFTDTTMTNIERMTLSKVGDYVLVFQDANVAAGTTFTFDASQVEATHRAFLNGSKETDGHFNMIGGAGRNSFQGGALDDTLQGGGGADQLTGGGGADTFVYTAASDSSGNGHDTVIGFDAAVDKFDLDAAVTGVSGPHDAGFGDHLNNDLGTAVNGNFDAGTNAMVVNGTSGDFNGRSLLVIDVDGNGNYDAGTDYVIDITGYAGTLAASNFI